MRMNADRLLFVLALCFGLVLGCCLAGCGDAPAPSAAPPACGCAAKGECKCCGDCPCGGKCCKSKERSEAKPPEPRTVLEFTIATSPAVLELLDQK